MKCWLGTGEKCSRQREHAVHAKARWQEVVCWLWGNERRQSCREQGQVWSEMGLERHAGARQGRDWVGHVKDSLVFNQRASFGKFLDLILFAFLEEHCYNQINTLKWSLWSYNMEGRLEGRKQDTGNKSGGLQERDLASLKSERVQERDHASLA